jgi:Putative beta-barrel porin-2, OmpL-like. bbp2
MSRNGSSGLHVTAACLIAAAAVVGTGAAAWAQQAPPAMAPAAPAPAAAPAAPTSNAMTTPAMAGPLVANPNPISSDSFVGKMYLNGAFSGLGLLQSDRVPVNGNNTGLLDFSNGMLSMQTTDGPAQFFVQFGVYSFPTVGAPYLHADRTTGDFFGPLPVAYGKVVVNDAFNVEAGKLPTLIGAEYGFSFQNMNIERGLLWVQEPIVSRGVQANYSMGPVALSASLNDGYYSDSYNWLSGSATWTINKANTLSVVGGGNFSQTGKNSFDSPFIYNNSDIFNIIYTYSNAPWTITPYFQYNHVSGNAFAGTPHDNSTIGGAVLASYAFNDNFSLAGRAEIIGSTGGTSDVLAVNPLGYGPGSAAVSFTITPTWQSGIWFARADGSVVSAWGTNTALFPVFGKSGTTTTQERLVIETGVVF